MPKRSRGGTREHNDFNKTVFSDNMHDLVRELLRLSPADAAVRIGVEANWMRKMCGRGVVRPDPRTRPQLQKVADFFCISIDDFWTPGLLASIWARRSCPKARERFIRDFHFEQVLKQNPELHKRLQEYIEDLEEMEEHRRHRDGSAQQAPETPREPGLPDPELSPSATMSDDLRSFLARAEESQDPSFVATARQLITMAHAATKEATPTISEMVETLCSTGRYDYLKNLIRDLYSVEKQRIQK